jgi:hypothetical protein
MEPQPFVATAKDSQYDYRTISHDMATLPQAEGGFVYTADEILSQSKVGVCTAISAVQNANKVLEKKFSPDFQYLLQKKFIDKEWSEGSSIFSSLKVGTKYGFLPESLWTYTTQADRDAGYPTYIAKLQAIPDEEIQRLIGLCTDKFTGYASVDVSNKQSLHKAISDSKAGILCRYNIYTSWWTATDGRISWSPADINPLRREENSVGGHAINMVHYNLNNETLANTWSSLWNLQGSATIFTDNYSPTEAFIPYYDFVPEIYSLPAAGTWHHTFTQQLNYGSTGEEVKNLQIFLMINNYLPLLNVADMGTFGNKTLKAINLFQTKNGIIPANRCGVRTLAILNQKYK